MLGYQALSKVSLSNISKKPHCYIGLILFYKNGQELVGSGILVSPNLVLTAAHNVFDADRQQPNYNIRFYPGQTGPEPFFECYEVESIRFAE